MSKGKIEHGRNGFNANEGAFPSYETRKQLVPIIAMEHAIQAKDRGATIVAMWCPPEGDWQNYLRLKCADTPPDMTFAEYHESLEANTYALFLLGIEGQLVEATTKQVRAEIRHRNLKNDGHGRAAAVKSIADNNRAPVTVIAGWRDEIVAMFDEQTAPFGTN